MEKILILAEEIFGHSALVDPAIAQNIKAAVSAIVDEAKSLSNAYALAVASAPKGNATSPAPTPEATIPAAPQLAASETASADPKPETEVASVAAPVNHVRADGTSVQIFK